MTTATQTAVPAANPHAYIGGAPITLTIVAVLANPKKPGSASYDRYARYPTAPFTLAEALAVKDGPTRADFLWDIRKGHLTVAEG